MLLAALVVLWFVVLVPMVVTRGDSRGGRAELADSGRTLQRRRSPDRSAAADTERVAIDRAQLVSSGELEIDVHALRRRTLAGLVALALVALAGALLFRAWMWAPQVFLDLAVLGYLLVLRRAARRERMAARRAARAAARAALRSPAPRAPERVERAVAAMSHGYDDRGYDDVAGGHSTVAAERLPHPSVPLAPVHPLRPGRVVAARTPAPAGWQNSAVVGLDDDDIGFADIDEYQPRRVANA
ncbi:hypothetical protein OF117_09425 [Geodermatophilus sp. YIM 151500]|uniref:hypothetical protein n=1 Tax=Geodermatophilus sp. YIM 151500 TaxID=2984531 RepID=UPI0021E45EBF|nr:hypothetical protein [Geodermatophilus sp. YIM 151500]MCV2489585.1 hypothetical protein [Geodermatophilus sp. YIM 151500]